MKIRPVILCGGAGTRLWPKKSNHQAKQFIDFGGWTLINKTFDQYSFERFICSCFSRQWMQLHFFINVLVFIDC